MLSAFKIDFVPTEFGWSVFGGLILTLVLRKAVHSSHVLLRSLATRPWIPAIALAGAMLILQFFVATRFGWPIPAVHDEFSYLLAADTFASGRATNPTHPAWEFLESYHIVWQPTSQSKYPPGNGLVLAAGQILTGKPIVGVWICLAASASLAFWMLRGWFSTVWAVLGAGILICNWPITKLWGQVFYSGAPAMLGGFLVFGALARLQRRPSLWHACWLSLGLILLAVTRPYEGLLTSLPALGLLMYLVVCTRSEERRRWLLLVISPAAAVLAGGFLLLGWYHWRVTGSPWIWPYHLYESTYSRRTNLLNTLLSFTELGIRTRTIPSMETESSAAVTRIAETKPLLYALWKLVRQWWVHVGLLATPPFCLAGYRALVSLLTRGADHKSSRIPTGLAVVTITLVLVAILLQRTAGHPHYAAPIHPLFLLLTVQGLRLLRTLRHGAYRIGSDLVSWFTWSMILFLVVPLCTGTNRPSVRPWSLDRDRIQTELEQRQRPQLVIVRYEKKHSMHEEWVYNRADIDRAKVVWARDLGPGRMSELLSHFPDRDVTIVEPDAVPIMVMPYTRRDGNAILPE